MNSVTPMAKGEGGDWDRKSVPNADEYNVTAEDAGLSVDFEHARPFHVKMAQKVIYLHNDAFPIVSARRESEDGLDEHITVYYVKSSDGTCLVLARTRSDQEDEDTGRAFLLVQYPQLLEEVPNLVEQGFEVTNTNADFVSEDLPNEYLPE